MRKRMINREWFSTKERKGIYTKGWRVKDRDNPVTP